LQPLKQRLLDWPHWGSLVLALTLILGAVFRLSDLAGRNLWTDEAWVALAALQPTPAGALAAGQSTPPFYLLTVWAAAHLFGGSEAVLRSLSCLFGLGTLLLFWPLARRLTSPAAARLALATMAFSPVMVYYSKELKQYGGDAFFAVLLFLLVERLLSHRGRGGWAGLALAGLVGLGFSHTLVFILPAAALALWLTLPPVCRPRLLGLTIFWGLALAFFYFWFFRGQVDPELVAYWAQDFPNFSGIFPFCRWLAAAGYRYLYYFLAQSPWAAAAVLLLALGGFWLWRHERRRALLYFAGPLILAFAAAAWHRYPFMAHYGGNRLMLFSAPMLYLVVAAGLSPALSWLWRTWRWPALPAACLGLLALLPLNLVQENLKPLNNREQIKPLVAHLENHLAPQDLVYVYYFAKDPFRYYYRGPAAGLCWGRSCVERRLKLPAAAAPSPQRLWLIASHIASQEQIGQFAANLLGPRWRQTDRLCREGAVLFQFERLGPSLAASQHPARP
jgi:4-amino-4-deoxy-L-arabinose transferase-like glycosyltransferase